MTLTSDNNISNEQMIMIMFKNFKFPWVSLIGFLLMLFVALSLVRNDRNSYRFYYSQECPSCAVYVAFIESNNLKHRFIFREVSQNYENFRELIETARIVKMDSIKVPIMFSVRTRKFYKDQEMSRVLLKLIKEQSKNGRKHYES